MKESITLSTGRVCKLQNPPLPFLAHYHVLSFPADQGQPSREEADEIILIAVLTGFLDRAQIFRTDEFRAQYEEPARANLAAALRQLPPA